MSASSLSCSTLHHVLLPNVRTALAPLPPILPPPHNRRLRIPARSPRALRRKSQTAPSIHRHRCRPHSHRSSRRLLRWLRHSQSQCLQPASLLSTAISRGSGIILSIGCTRSSYCCNLAKTVLARLPKRQPYFRILIDRSSTNSRRSIQQQFIPFIPFAH